jgi:hypothetical protein
VADSLALWARERTVDYTGDQCCPLFSQFGWMLSHQL